MYNYYVCFRIVLERIFWKEGAGQMLELNNIVKNYTVGDTEIHALKGVSMKFRESEFVSILGQSGCGKTTLLNIIGGLDQYTNGDLIINGRSTKQYKDRDWDTYRNHSVGFVFQSYNLIPHQTVLSNVELALTLSGVSKSERRRRAIEALEKVGLGDQLGKKPNQMSGGQMQRVAIARALVNEPDILLADEPTGALDSETSVQIMELLKDIAKDRLIIMVTHNPDLAEKYSTRIIRLLDGEVKADSNPFDGTVSEGDGEASKTEVVKKKASMSFFTALSLSMNNLMTKKGRTFMTAFAGSIGIIGIALILSLSSGAQDYIDRVQEETLSSYPLTIEGTSIDMTTIMTTMMTMAQGEETDIEANKIYPQNVMTTMMEAMFAEISANDLKTFKEFLESGESGIGDLVSDIKYSYQTQLTLYKADTSDGVYKVNPSSIFDNMGLSQMAQNPFMASSMNIWREMISKEEILKSQYTVLAGRMPENYNEVVLIVNRYNQVTDYTLYSLGILDDSELSDAIQRTIDGETVENINSVESIDFDQLLGLKFKLLLNTDYFEKDGDIWVDKRSDTIFMTEKVNAAEEIEIVGIIRPSDNTAAANEIGTIGYKTELMTHLINKVNDSEIVKEQKANPDTDIFTGAEFPDTEEEPETMTMDELNAYIMSLPEEEQQAMMMQIQQAMEMGMTEEQITQAFSEQLNAAETDATYEGNLALMGVSDLDDPSSISIYPRDFEAKELITDIIDDYNKRMDDSGNDDLCIQYTDIMGIMMSSITTIIDAISYILIAFVAISLVVSSIMIGIITYISVLERTKEIGILRSIGASKKDISRVFNAETLIVGFTAGAFGIITTLLLNIPINIIITHLTDVEDLCHLPPMGGAILVVISMILTLIAGLIPSGVAARKDPVTALRTDG